MKREIEGRLQDLIFGTKDNSVIIIEGARHGVHFQQPEILGETILEFLEKNIQD